MTRQDLSRLAATLSDPQSRPEQRDEAARRLVSRQSPDARKILNNALADFSNAAGQLAAARALAEDPHPDPEMITSLFALLGSNRQLTEAAARALASYKSDPLLLQRLIQIVQTKPPVAESIRREIIRALGSMVTRQSAELLVSLLKNPDETVAIHNAAADALADMTGITDYGQDPQQWSNWWNRMSGLSNEQFCNELLPRRSARFDQLRQQYTDLSTELKNILEEQYQAASPEGRTDIIMKHLRSAVPEVRASAAAVVDDDVLANNTIPAAVKAQLRSMIGDSSAKVRYAVAVALADMNDIDALEPLLAQLAQETDPSVRPKLIRALQQINDPRAAWPLLKLLNDPAYETARAAAKAIEQLGPKIRDNPLLAQQTAAQLQKTFESLPATAGNSEMRAALVGAMVPLQQEQLRSFFTTLIQDESPAIRRLALKGLGEIGNSQSAAIIAGELEDSASTVRLEAVNALSNMPNAADYAEPLRRHLDPNIEPDQSVRDATWTTLQTIFPNLSAEQLQSFAEHFKDQPARQQVILKAEADKLLKDKREDDLATVRINIGMADMALGDYKEAAEYFRQALEYKRTRSVPGVAIAQLIEQRMKALLLSKQYPEATAFAADSIKSDPANQQSVGAAIRQEADRLSRLSNTADLDDALKLIAEAQKMNPPLARQHLEQLSEIESNIKKKLSEGTGGAGAATLPAQSASFGSNPTTR